MRHKSLSVKFVVMTLGITFGFLYRVRRFKCLLSIQFKRQNDAKIRNHNRSHDLYRRKPTSIEDYLNAICYKYIWLMGKYQFLVLNLVS